MFDVQLGLPSQLCGCASLHEPGLEARRELVFKYMWIVFVCSEDISYMWFTFTSGSRAWCVAAAFGTD